MLFQDTLKELRKKKGISQYDLADELNISRSVIAKWETGLTLPSEENTILLMQYFNISREELFKNEETEAILMKKNVSISKMKKLIISLSAVVLVLIIVLTIILISYVPKSLSKQLDKLGDFENVKISLYDTINDQTYYLDSSEKEIHDKVLFLLNDLEYQFYPSNMIVEKWIGSYTICLEGDIKIYINLGYLIIDGENRAVKNYFTNNIEIVIDLLISSESIEIIDEPYYQ